MLVDTVQLLLLPISSICERAHLGPPLGLIHPKHQCLHLIGLTETLNPPAAVIWNIDHEMQASILLDVTFPSSISFIVYDKVWRSTCKYRRADDIRQCRRVYRTRCRDRGVIVFSTSINTGVTGVWFSFVGAFVSKKMGWSGARVRGCWDLNSRGLF